MLDGAEFAAALASRSGDAEAACSAYERDMFPRSAEVALLGTSNGSSARMRRAVPWSFQEHRRGRGSRAAAILEPDADL